jgi:hypothetical protein
MSALPLVQGWRFVFFVMAGVATTVTFLVMLFGVEPRKLLYSDVEDGASPRKEQHGVRRLLRTVGKGVAAMFTDAVKVFRVPSFVLILFAEIIMVVGGSGAGYQIMYFQVRNLPCSASVISFSSIPAQESLQCKGLIQAAWGQIMSYRSNGSHVARPPVLLLALHMLLGLVMQSA